MNKTLKVYDENGNINKELVDFCHRNPIIQNLKNELIREFSSIWAIGLFNKIDDEFEDYFRRGAYELMHQHYEDGVPLSIACSICMTYIIDNFKIIRTNLYRYCIDQLYNKKDSSLESSNNNIKDPPIPVIR